MPSVGDRVIQRAERALRSCVGVWAIIQHAAEAPLWRVARVVARLPAPLALVALGYIAALGPLHPLVELVAALGCFLAASRTHLPARVTWILQWLAIPALLWAGIVLAPQTVGIIADDSRATLSAWPPAYGSDAMYYNHYDALLVLRGDNPYVGDHLADATRYLHIAGYTPLARGRFTDLRHYPQGAAYGAPMAEYRAHPWQVPPEVDPRTVHSYPAGAFLVDVPFVWAGLPSIAFPQIALFLLLSAVLVVAAPAEARLGIALLLLAASSAAGQAAGVDFDIWPLALLIGAWMLAERRATSSLLLGAACAIKQTIWLAAPFYLIWVWRSRGGREAANRAGMALAIFLAVNLPWIVASPREWFASLWLPVSLPLFPGGSGIVALSLAGVLPLFPSWVYGLLELATLAGALIWYWRALPRYRFAGLLLPYLPLLMAWRSSDRYFSLLPLTAVAVLVLTLRAAAAEGAAEHAIAIPPATASR